MAGLAYTCSTVQEQLLCLCGALGQVPGRSQPLSFHHLRSTYKRFMEILITPASKLSPWFTERI